MMSQLGSASAQVTGSQGGLAARRRLEPTARHHNPLAFHNLLKLRLRDSQDTRQGEKKIVGIFRGIASSPWSSPCEVLQT